MRILLLCHDLSTRLRLESAWAAQGLTVIKKDDGAAYDCAVVDLGRRDALDEVARLRAGHPGLAIVACAEKYEEGAVQAAKAAGANDFAARSFVDRRIARLFKLPG